MTHFTLLQLHSPLANISNQVQTLAAKGLPLQEADLPVNHGNLHIIFMLLLWLKAHFCVLAVPVYTLMTQKHFPSRMSWDTPADVMKGLTL